MGSHFAPAAACTAAGTVADRHMGGHGLRLMGGDGLPVWLQSSKQQQREQQQQQRVFCALIKVAATVVSVASKMTAKPFAWPGARGTKQLPKSCNDACSSRYCYISKSTTCSASSEDLPHSGSSSSFQSARLYKRGSCCSSFRCMTTGKIRYNSKLQNLPLLGYQPLRSLASPSIDQFPA